MRVKLLPLCALLCISTSALAQFPIQGFLYNWDRPNAGDGLSYVTRFGVNAEQHLMRIDRDDHVDWGINSAGQVQIQGFMLWIQDANDATVEQFSIVGFPETAPGSELPDLQNQTLNAGPYQMPPTGNPPGGIAYELFATFAQPATFANGTDIFIGSSVPALLLAQPPYDGLWTGVASNDNSGMFTTFDVPGPRGQQGGGIANDTYVCYVVNGVATYPASSATSLEQLAFDVHISGGGVGGVALTTTNQTSYPSSGAGLGTSNFLSGLHPDLARGDNLGFAITAHNTQVTAAQTIAGVLLALGPFPAGSLPITTIFPAAAPGSSGLVCIDFTQAATFAFLPLANNPNSLQDMLEWQFNLNLPASFRAGLLGAAGPVNVWWQGILIEIQPSGALEVRTTGCEVQHIK